jgi:hypothetical protein
MDIDKLLKLRKRTVKRKPKRKTKPKKFFYVNLSDNRNFSRI